MLEVRQNRPGAFERLVERYQGRLLGILSHVVGRVDEAEDLVQDVFLRVYRARATYEPTARFSTWLFTIANNLAMNHLRSRGRHPARVLSASPPGASTSALLPVDQLASPEASASAQMRKAELAEVVRQALDALGEDQKMAVLLNKFEGLAYAEIAQVMGRSEEAVKSLLARARFNLKERLQPYIETGRRVPDVLPAAQDPATP
jgi:RNA polymerase sigma-70 factor (ECF subfamily)